MKVQNNFGYDVRHNEKLWSHGEVFEFSAEEAANLVKAGFEMVLDKHEDKAEKAEEK